MFLSVQAAVSAVLCNCGPSQDDPHHHATCPDGIGKASGVGHWRSPKKKSGSGRHVWFTISSLEFSHFEKHPQLHTWPFNIFQWPFTPGATACTCTSMIEYTHHHPSLQTKRHCRLDHYKLCTDHLNSKQASGASCFFWQLLLVPTTMQPGTLLSLIELCHILTPISLSFYSLSLISLIMREEPATQLKLDLKHFVVGTICYSDCQYLIS